MSAEKKFELARERMQSRIEQHDIIAVDTDWNVVPKGVFECRGRNAPLSTRQDAYLLERST